MERQLADNPNQRWFPGFTSCMQGPWDSLDKGILTGRISFCSKVKFAIACGDYSSIWDRQGVHVLEASTI
jgi:hypothetical protein